MTNKDRLQRLVEELPESELDAARRYLEYLRDTTDPLLRKLLDAPEDDEPESEQRQAAEAEAEEDFRAGRVFSQEEVKREFGL